jgi:hypothetical protein
LNLISVSSKHVINKAFCVYKASMKRLPNDLYVYSTGKFGSNTGSKIRIRKIFIHPDYKYDRSPNNVAVSVLEKPVSFTPVCLPQPNDPIEEIFDKQLIAYGVGYEDDKNATNVRYIDSDQAKYVLGFGVPKAQCDPLVGSKDLFCINGRDGFGPCDGKFFLSCYLSISIRLNKDKPTNLFCSAKKLFSIEFRHAKDVKTLELRVMN